VRCTNKARVVERVIFEHKKQKLEMKQAKASKKSSEIMKNKGNRGKVHQRLYKDRPQRAGKEEILEENDLSKAKESQSQTFDECTFKPNVRSRFMPQIVSKEKVDRRLVRDAEKRKQKLEAMKQEHIKNIKMTAKPKNSEKSQEYVFKRFSKEYDETLADMGKQRKDKFKFQELQNILIKLGFVNERDVVDKEENIVSDVWIILGGESTEEINESSIFHILCVILNFDRPFLYGDMYLSASRRGVEGVIEEEVDDKNTVGIIGKDGVFYLRNVGELERLHHYFYDLTFNRINFVNKKSQIDKMNQHETTKRSIHSVDKFRPTIDFVSDTIEKTKKEEYGKIPRYELLIERGKVYKSKVSNIALENKDKELVGCTFKPNINKKYNTVKRTKTRSVNMSIEESKTKLKSLMKTQDFNSCGANLKTLACEAIAANRSKKLQPKVNRVIMELKPGKDPIVSSVEVVEEYKQLANERPNSSLKKTEQQSSSLFDKIKEAQQCYKSFNPEQSNNAEAEDYEDILEKRFSIENKHEAKYLPNFLDYEISPRDEDEKSKGEYSHSEEQRYEELDKELKKQYRMSQDYIEEDPQENADGEFGQSY
jgi:hypothetical protein